MTKLIKKIQKKIAHIICSLICTAIVLLMLAVLVVWSGFMLQLTVGLLLVIMAYMFFYAAYKIWSIKKEIEKYFKL
jgi:uncharacterized membrane protein